jgi:hypothetical protein
MELTVSDRQYVTTERLNAFDQLHLARKLSPALPIIEGLVDPANVGKDKQVLTVLLLSHVADADVDFVLRKCLRVVCRRQADGQLARLQSSDGQLMFSDTSLADLLELAVNVIEENLGDFFRTALGALAAGAAQSS